jgi:hypothetical protein
MGNKLNKYIYWTPRIFSILFILFLALFSLDVISPKLSTQQIFIGLLMHNIPVFILSIVLLVSWKYEIVGAIVFILAGVLYVATMIRNMFLYQFEGYMLSYCIIIAGPAFLIGFLFIINWFRKGNHKDSSIRKNSR